MKKRISLYVRSVLAFLRIVITKIFNIKGFHSAFIQDFSITTKISVNERGKILLKKHIHTKRNVILCAEGGTLEIGEGCFFIQFTFLTENKSPSFIIFYIIPMFCP